MFSVFFRKRRNRSTRLLVCLLGQLRVSPPIGGLPWSSHSVASLLHVQSPWPPCVCVVFPLLVGPKTREGWVATSTSQSILGGVSLLVFLPLPLISLSRPARILTKGLVHITRRENETKVGEERRRIGSVPSLLYRCSTPEGTTLLVQQGTFLFTGTESSYRHRFHRILHDQRTSLKLGNLWLPVGGL